MLPLLLSLQVQSGQPAQVLLAHSLVNSGSSADPLPVVVGSISPPVGLCFHIPQDHVLYSCGEARYFPWDVGFPAAPSLTQMLQDGTSFVLFDTFWHHVQDVMHYL